MNVLIPSLDEDTVKELEEQAKENNRSFEEHLKAILEARADYRRRSRSFDSTDLIHQMRYGCEWCGDSISIHERADSGPE
jgi:RNA polymerase-binding transcription factor DksA